MSDPSYPLDLLRAELKSAMAEQLVALIDRFATKRDIADFRGDFITHQLEDKSQFQEINFKLDELLAEKSERDGATEERNLLRSRRDFWIGVAAALVVGFIGAAAALAAIPFVH